MRSFNSPRVLAAIVAIATTIWFIWYYPHYILSLGLASTGAPLREVYQAQTITDLPESIQALTNYQYALAVLFAIASFGAVYFGLSIDSIHAFILFVGCLIPIAAFIFFPLILLSAFVSLVLLIWLIWLYNKSNPQLLVPYLFCFAVNAIGTIALWFNLKDIFAIIA